MRNKCQCLYMTVQSLNPTSDKKFNEKSNNKWRYVWCVYKLDYGSSYKGFRTDRSMWMVEKSAFAGRMPVPVNFHTRNQCCHDPICTDCNIFLHIFHLLHIISTTRSTAIDCGHQHHTLFYLAATVKWAQSQTGIKAVKNWYSISNVAIQMLHIRNEQSNIHMQFRFAIVCLRIEVNGLENIEIDVFFMCNSWHCTLMRAYAKLRLDVYIHGTITWIPIFKVH